MTHDKTYLRYGCRIKALPEGKDLSGKDGILPPLIKQLTEAAMRVELEEHLASEDKPSRKNGYTSKTMKSPAGSFELDTPRDRADTLEPQIIKKRQTQLTDELELKVIALFAPGNNYQYIPHTLIACLDGLQGFPEAIESIYPKTEVQHCVIYQIRNSMKYVASKNQKAFMADLKCVYKAATLNATESHWTSWKPSGAINTHW